MVIGAFLFVKAIVNAPEMIWTHPTFTEAEQEQAKSECHMRAYEAIGGAPIHDQARKNYQESCWKEKGFKQVEVRKEEEDDR